MKTDNPSEAVKISNLVFRIHSLAYSISTSLQSCGYVSDIVTEASEVIQNIISESVIGEAN